MTWHLMGSTDLPAPRRGVSVGPQLWKLLFCMERDQFPSFSHSRFIAGAEASSAEICNFLGHPFPLPDPSFVLLLLFNMGI